MSDKEVVEVLVRVYRQFPATGPVPEDRDVVPNLLREAEEWPDQHSAPVVPPSDQPCFK